MSQLPNQPQGRPDIQEYLRELQARRAEASKANMMQNMLKAGNKLVGGDGSMMDSQIANNNQGVANYESDQKLIQKDYEAGKAEAAASELDDPNSPRSMMLRKAMTNSTGKDPGPVSYNTMMANKKAGGIQLQEARSTQEGLNSRNAADNERVVSEKAKDREAKSASEKYKLENQPKKNIFEDTMNAEAAKEVTKYLLTNRNTLTSNLSELDDVQARYASGEAKTGGLLGTLNFEKPREIWDKKNLAAERDVERLVQQSLKAILGAQFAQKEAQQLFKRTIDPSADTEVTKQRLRWLKASLSKRMNNMDAVAQEAMRTGKAFNLEAFQKQMLNELVDEEKAEFGVGEGTPLRANGGGEEAPAPVDSNGGMTPEEQAELDELERQEAAGEL